MTKPAAVVSLDALSLEEKIGQLVMVDFSGPGVPAWLREGFSRYHWGGVILFAKNVETRATYWMPFTPIYAIT